MDTSSKEQECHPAQKLIDVVTPSPYDEYKPYPVQAKIDPSDPLYHEYEKELKYSQTKASTKNADDDPPSCDVKKATQFGYYERVVELVNSGQDVNELDADGVSLLHWAAINNKKDIARFLLERGAIIDKSGGALNSTPLHWAARQGHLPMVVFLMAAGADPTEADGEGYQCLHLASMFSHSSIVAYLVAKGYDVDTVDKNGMTPLMWACYRSASMDPTRLLITLGADINRRDTAQGNTPLHWALLVGNHTALTRLCKQKVDLNVLNNAGQSPLDVAVKKKNRWIVEKVKRQRLEKGFDSRGFFHCRTTDNKDFRLKYMIVYPFFALWAIGWAFEADYWWTTWWSRLLLLFFVFLSFKYSKKWFFDERLANTIPFGLYLATKFWMYFTWFFYALPYIPGLTIHALFFINSAFLIYHFHRSVTNDPGFISPTRQQQIETIIALAEQETISIEQFCSSCLIRKPLRSKHCSVCDKCVAKFDHHCPWIFNCVGAGNIKNFMLYLTFLIGMILWCMYGCISFWSYGCKPQPDSWPSTVTHSISCSPWTAWIFLNSCIHLLFVGILLGNILYQVLYLGLTTNERLNLFRYDQFKKDGKYNNPYHRGILLNCVDEMKCKCFGLFRPLIVDWRTTYTYTQPGDQHPV